MTNHIDLHNKTHMEKAQEAYQNRSRLSVSEVEFIQACIADLQGDGDLENPRHYAILDAMWKKALGLTP